MKDPEKQNKQKQNKRKYFKMQEKSKYFFPKPITFNKANGNSTTHAKSHYS